MTDSQTIHSIHDNLLNLRMFSAESVIDSQLEQAVNRDASLASFFDQILDLEVKVQTGFCHRNHIEIIWLADQEDLERVRSLISTLDR